MNTDWTYGIDIIKSIDDMPKKCIGFIYHVECYQTGEMYIGKKSLFHKKTMPPLKGFKRKRKSIVESDWLNYHGSNDKIKKLKEKGNIFDRQILEFAFSKKQLTYLETRYQFVLKVLEDDRYLNSNILGKFYANDFVSDENKKAIEERF